MNINIKNDVYDFSDTEFIEEELVQFELSDEYILVYHESLHYWYVEVETEEGLIEDYFIEDTEESFEEDFYIDDVLVLTVQQFKDFKGKISEMFKV